MVWRGVWDGVWDGNWEGVATPLAPGFIRGSATILLSSVGTLSVPLVDGSMVGAATITIGATGSITFVDSAPPIEVTQPTPAPGTYGSVGQRTNVHVWRGEDLSRRMTDRRAPPSRDNSDAQDLLDIVQIFDELRLAA
jgi:hypothetical protein